MKYLKFFESFNQYDYSNVKDNPNKIVIKFKTNLDCDRFREEIFAPGISFEEYNFVYYESWSDLAGWDSRNSEEAKGLQMEDGKYYLLYKKARKIFDEKSKSGTSNCPATYYFLEYSKESGEITLWSVNDSDGTEYAFTEPSKEYHYSELKGKYKTCLFYCRFDKGDQSRIVGIDSTDHQGYFKVIEVNM